MNSKSDFVSCIGALKKITDMPIFSTLLCSSGFLHSLSKVFLPLSVVVVFLHHLHPSASKSTMNPDQPKLTIITNPSKKDHYSHRPISLPSKPNAASELTSFGLIGRLKQSCNRNKVRAILSKAWKTPNGISINDLNSNLFLFRFHLEDDRQNILNLGP